MIHPKHSISILFLLLSMLITLLSLVYCFTLNSAKAKAEKKKGSRKNQCNWGSLPYNNSIFSQPKTFDITNEIERVINTVIYSYKKSPKTERNTKIKKKMQNSRTFLLHTIVQRATEGLMACTNVVNVLQRSIRQCSALCIRFCFHFCWHTSDVNIYLFICAWHTINQ